MSEFKTPLVASYFPINKFHYYFIILSPSLSGEVSATMSVDGIAAMAGLEVQASLSSSSTLEGRLSAHSLTDFNLDINLPTQHMELVNVTSVIEC